MAKYTKETTLYRKSKLQDALDKAQSTADNASTKADNASATASNAQSTADGAATALDGLMSAFSVDAQGAHIICTDENGGIYRNDLTPNGMEIRSPNGLVSQFSNKIELGDNVSIDYTGVLRITKNIQIGNYYFEARSNGGMSLKWKE